MHAIASFTFAGHARTQELSHAKFIVGSDVEQLLQLQARLPGPWLSAKETNFEFSIFEIDATFVGFTADIKTYRRSHTHSRYAEINNEIDHAVILSGIRTHGDCHRIHRHCPIVKPKTTCRKAIAVAVHQNITRTHASHPQFACIEI